MHMCARWIWYFLLLALAGCATYERRPLSPATTLDNFEARTLDAEPLAAYLRKNLDANEPAPGTWGLTELTLAAFFYSPRLDVARAQWAVAQAQEKTAAERPNPTLGVTPGFNSTTGYGAAISPWIVGTVLDIPIETAGKRGYRVAEARYLSEAARLHIAQTAWGVRSQVRKALLDLYGARQAKDLLDRRYELQLENVEMLEHLFEVGEISANELSRARVARDEANLARLDARKQQAQALAQLAEAIGIPLDALESVQFSFGAFRGLPEDVPSREARRQALLHREDLLAAIADYQASQAALQQAIAGQYPDIQLGPGYEFDQSENKWTVGLSVSVPVFNRNQGAIATAEAQREEAAATFRDTQAQILSQIELAVTSYRASSEKVRAAETIENQLAQTADRVSKMYEAGELTKLDVTAARLEFNAGAVRQLEARVEAFQDFGQLEDAMHMAADLPSQAVQTTIAQQGDHDRE